MVSPMPSYSILIGYFITGWGGGREGIRLNPPGPPLDLPLDITEPCHQISNNVVCATSKASDQPAHSRSLISAFASRLNILTVKLLPEHHLEFLSLKGGYTCSSESTHVKMPHCWKSHVMAQLSRFSKTRVTHLFWLYNCFMT